MAPVLMSRARLVSPTKPRPAAVWDVLNAEFLLDKVGSVVAWIGSVKSSSAVSLLLLEMVIAGMSIAQSVLKPKKPSSKLTPKQAQKFWRIQIGDRFFHFVTFGLSLGGFVLAAFLCADDGFSCVNFIAPDSTQDFETCMAVRKEQGCVIICDGFAYGERPNDKYGECRSQWECDDDSICTTQGEENCGARCEVCSSKRNVEFCRQAVSSHVGTERVYGRILSHGCP